MDDSSHSQAYEALNKAWKSTCRVVLGEEVGELERYGPWLSEHMSPLLRKKSALSGKDVCCAVPDYAPGAKFISLDEADFGKTFEPLGINEIKDIDSIIDAVSERFAYCGNVVLGNSSDVERSSDVHNSFHVLNSNFIYDCEYTAYSSLCRGSKYLFGVISDYGCSHLIRVYEDHRQARCLEAWNCYDSSDCYFSSFVEGSHDAMFSFSVRNKRNVIGNLELPKEKYLALKAKLLGEIREELERNGRLPSLMDIAASGEPAAPVPGFERPQKSGLGGGEDAGGGHDGLAPIEEAFGKTTALLFGRQLHDFRSYGKWLMRHVPPVEKLKSAVSGRTLYSAGIYPLRLYLRDRLVTEDECWEVGERVRLEMADLESFERLKHAAGRIAYFSPEGRLGECRNLIEVPLSNTSQDCYHCPIAAFNEKVAYSYWPRHSKYMFGTSLAFRSTFCISAYNSTDLARVFEAEGCGSCSDGYFLHNCENVRDSMFCFNAKNLHSAIGNSPLPPEQYRKIKKVLLGQMADELERNNGLKWDIYNIGCAK